MASAAVADSLFISKEELCTAGAIEARTAYKMFAETEKKMPTLTRDEIAESIRQGIYMRFKEDIKKDDSKIGASFAELKRGWRDRGVTDYLADQNRPPATYERDMYAMCIGFTKK